MTLTTPSDLEIVMTRDFDAPRELVFEAWTKPEHLTRWWGPRGHTMPVCEVDLRPGGSYRFVNRAPDGTDHPFKGVYREIVPPERLVCTQIYDVEGWSNRECLVTLIFAERDGRTTMTNTVLFDSVEDRDAMLESGMEGGAAESLDRLAELLGSMA
jgi:uncharacterized protein YndB with AHSA1/START domain